MEGRPIDVLQTYTNFRIQIKSLIESNKSSMQQCVIITKEDMTNWKKLYEYSKKLIYNNDDLNQWESKINLKNIQKPTFHILKDYNEIKNHLNKGNGLSFVNIDFINYFVSSSKIKIFNCYFGCKRMVIEIKNDKTYSNCLICKTGSKSTLQYFIFEKIVKYKKSLIDEILNKKKSLLEDKTKFQVYLINKIIIHNCKKIQNNNFSPDNTTINNKTNIHNNNNIVGKGNISKSAIDSFTNKISGIYKCNVPACIFEFLIFSYKFNKDLRKLIKAKDKSTYDYYILNAEFLNHIKKLYKYKAICEVLDKFKYKSEYEFEKEIPNLINSIMKNGIINEVVPLEDMKMIPFQEHLYNKWYNVNFCIINDKIYKTLEQIKKYFTLTKRLDKIKYSFYFCPQLFYKGKGVLRIGALNSEDVFETHYLIDIDLYNSVLFSVLYELNNSKTMKDFFQKKHIDIDKKEIKKLIY